MDKHKKDIGAYEYFKEQHGQSRDFVDKLMDTPMPVVHIEDTPPAAPYTTEGYRSQEAEPDFDPAKSPLDGRSNPDR